MRRTNDGIAEAVATAYRGGESVPVLTRRLGIPKSTGYAVLSRLGIDRRDRIESHRTCAVDHGFFDAVDSPAKAYVLGFLTADGCVHKNSVSVYLGAKDADQVGLIRRLLGSTHGVAVNRRCVGLSIKSERLVAGLAAVGVGPQKTFTVRPWTGPADLMPHYWRGLLDGDGCWGIRNDRGRTTGYVDLGGTWSVCRGFLDFVRHATGTAAGSFGAMKSVWRVRFSGVGMVQRIVPLVYPAGDFPYMPRKRAIADRIMKLIGRKNYHRSRPNG